MEEFEKIFKILMFTMKLTGTNPYAKKDQKWILIFVTFHGVSTLVLILVVYNIVYHDIKNNDFTQICKNSVFSIVCLANIFMYSVPLLHRQTLLELIEDMKNDYASSKDLPPQEQEVILFYAKKAVKLFKLWVFIPVLSTGLFLFKSIALFIYYDWIGEFQLVPFYELKYPGILETNKNNIVVFLLMYVLISYFGFSSALLYTTFIPLGPMFMLHACGQLDIVKMRLEHVFDERDDQVIMMKIKIIVQQVQYIYRFVERINSSFPGAYELTLKDTTFILPVACYELIESLKRGVISLEFLTFIISGALISVMPCYYSDMLMEKGEELRQALYCCGWERIHDLRIRTMLQVIVTRATRPVAIRAMLRILCLEALKDVFHQSYAIFNLMNAVWN